MKTRFTIIILIAVELLLLFSMGDYAPSYNAAEADRLMSLTQYSQTDYADMLELAQSLEAKLGNDSPEISEETKTEYLEQYLTFTEILFNARENGLMSPSLEHSFDLWLESTGG